MPRIKISGNLILLTAALIWGSAFVAQSIGMDYIGPFTFNSIRSFIGGLILLPYVFYIRKNNVKTEKPQNDKNKNTLIIGGLICGVIMAVASNLQQIGIMTTTVGKAGFLTSLYIILVPVILRLIGKKVRVIIWFCVAMAMVGMYLLTINETLHLGTGDLLIILCAFFFSLHIISIDYFAPKVEVIMLACIQFWVCGTLSAFPMFIFEHPEISKIFDAWMPILYAGVLSSGVAYTLQMVGQKRTKPTNASLILSLESVFAAVTAWLILNETLSIKEIAGCTLIFIAIILSQIPIKLFIREKIVIDLD